MITVLVDDEAGKGLTPEHGLSLWVEAEGKRILFDTGQGNALVENARQLGVPLHKTDILILSHGHYDHTGGVADVLSIAPGVRLLFHPKAVTPRYSLHPGKPTREIGMPQSARSAIDRMQENRITWAVQPVRLNARMGVTGPIPRETSFEDVGGPFFRDPNGVRRDAITDDQALWIDSGEGLVVCVGCCHAGLINTLNYVRRVSGNDSIRAIMGGFHLLQADDQRIERTLDALRSMSPGLLVPCHCTGERAVLALKETFGDQVISCVSGMTFQF